MATYTLFTASYGTGYANVRVRITEQATGKPAIIMASATSGVLSQAGNAMTDSSGNLSVYLDSSKTFQVYYNQFVLTPSNASLAYEIQRTAAQLATTPTQSDIAIGSGASFYLDTNPAAQYRISADKTQYILITGSGGGGGGSVTSVAVTAPSGKLSVTGGPITSAGTLILDVVESQLTLSNLGGTLAANKVTGLATVATSGSYTDLTSKPSIPSAYTDTQARAALSLTGPGGSYNSSTGVITLSGQQTGTISANTTLSNFHSGGRYKITASISITVPVVGTAGGDSNTFLANFDCEFYLASGITVTFVPATSSVVFNYTAGSATRIQSAATNAVIALISDPTVSNVYALTGS